MSFPIPVGSPVDSPIRALWKHLDEVTSPYFQTLYKYSSTLNHLRERRKMAASGGLAKYGLLSLDQNQTIDDVREKAWIVYNRSPITPQEGMRHQTHQVIVNSSDPSYFKVRDFIFGSIQVTSAFACRDAAQMDAFESLYLMRFRHYSTVVFEVKDVGAEEPLQLRYDIQAQPIQSIDQSDEENLGSYWVCPFNITINGPFISPESSEYPRLLKILGTVYVSDIIRTLDGVALPDVLGRTPQISWRKENQIKEGLVVGSTFFVLNESITN